MGSWVLPTVKCTYELRFGQKSNKTPQQDVLARKLFFIHALNCFDFHPIEISMSFLDFLYDYYSFHPSHTFPAFFPFSSVLPHANQITRYVCSESPWLPSAAESFPRRNHLDKIVGRRQHRLQQKYQK